jgi:hypothetical protein
LLTLGAGLFAAAALVYTARNFVLTRRTVQLTGRTVELTEQGQVTDRYTKAIEQLGSDKLDVRIGGIYALERIGRDSPRDHPTVMEVLAAFIRQHSHEPWPLQEPGASTTEAATRPDVQAGVTVITGRDTALASPRIDLSRADLTRADLDYANFRGADLIGVTFTSAHLYRADFDGSNLEAADFSRAHLGEARLTDVWPALYGRKHR